MASIVNRFRSGWNAFLGRDPTEEYRNDYGSVTSYRPDRIRFTRGNEQSIVASIYNRIAMDVMMIDFRHVVLDKDGQYKETVDSTLNDCLTVEANADQTAKAFIQDIVQSMFDEGVVAIVPTDTTTNPEDSSSYDINELRVAKILQWYPLYVKVRCYNERIGKTQDIVMAKSAVGIIENPLYSIMNEPNSTLQRLIRTINALDVANAQNGSGKLDIIIQLPYTIRSDIRKKQAEERRKSIETQLAGSKYGIAYADATEHITQLNRSAENNLFEQSTTLTAQLYNQLGLTTTIFDGSADEKTMLNYYNRTIDPICSAIADEILRKFVSKTARTQNKSIKYFRDPFSLVPVGQLADIADKFTRNEILSSNEVRAVIGYKPSSETRANQLVNKNINIKDAGSQSSNESQDSSTSVDEIQNDSKNDSFSINSKEETS